MQSRVRGGQYIGLHEMFQKYLIIQEFYLHDDFEGRNCEPETLVKCAPYSQAPV